MVRLDPTDADFVDVIHTDGSRCVHARARLFVCVCVLCVVVCVCVCVCVEKSSNKYFHFGQFLILSSVV